MRYALLTDVSNHYNYKKKGTILCVIKCFITNMSIANALNKSEKERQSNLKHC